MGRGAEKKSGVARASFHRALWAKGGNLDFLLSVLGSPFRALSRGVTWSVLCFLKVILGSGVESRSGPGRGKEDKSQE